MSRRVVVIVPISFDGSSEHNSVVHVENRVVASFALTNGGAKPVVERAGSLAALAHALAYAAEDDVLLVGFAAVCAHANRVVPNGLRVRVSSRVHLQHGREIVSALTVAGMAAANALLVLGVGDHELARIAAQAVGNDFDGMAAALSGYTIAVHHDCGDGSETVATQAASVS